MRDTTVDEEEPKKGMFLFSHIGCDSSSTEPKKYPALTTQSPDGSVFIMNHGKLL